MDADNNQQRKRFKQSDYNQPANDKRFAVTTGASRSQRKPISAAILLIATVLALAVGIFLGLVVPKIFDGSLDAKESYQEADLEKAVVGTFTFNGKQYDITLKEVIQDATSMDAYVSEDGTYSAPSAEAVLASARNRVSQLLVEAENIEVTEEDKSEYKLQAFGTEDMESIKELTGLPEDQLNTLIDSATGLYKLRIAKFGEVEAVGPMEPADPVDGQTDIPTVEYAQYIITLAGENWDSEAGTWADPESDWALALDGTNFTSDAADYDAAELAYYVALDEYFELLDEANAEWIDYLNSVFSSSEVTIGSLATQLQIPEPEPDLPLDFEPELMDVE